MRKDVVIIGAGASGLMCAATAGARKRSVLILDHAGKIANKVRISGGGRCNFTNLNTDSNHYVSENPHFPKSALSRFSPRDIMSMLERHGIRYHEKEEGQLFCAGRSGEIIRMLQDACERSGAGIVRNCRITAIEKKESFIITTNQGVFTATSLAVATGGLSYPNLGATDLGYRIAGQFGLAVTPLRPGLVPLTLSKADRENFRELSGISFRAVVSCGKTSFDGMVLLTHRGLSGPAILQISLYWQDGKPVVIRLIPDRDPLKLLMEQRRSRVRIDTLLSGHLPERFARKWCGINLTLKPMIQYSDGELREIAEKLGHWEVWPAGTEGYTKAEVTAGGVDTRGISSKSMEANQVPGLYFIGEVLDVTGHLGGFNLQWAWSSGYAAGQHV